MGRYTILNRIDETRHIQKCPLILLGSALTADKEKDAVLAQFKFQNISDRRIKAVYISVDCFGVNDESLECLKQFVYSDLDLAKGTIFGGNVPVYLPNKETRKINITVDFVLYEDDSKWENSDKLYFQKFSGKGNDTLDEKLKELEGKKQTIDLELKSVVEEKSTEQERKKVNLYKCPNCKKMITEDIECCPYCGTPINKISLVKERVKSFYMSLEKKYKILSAAILVCILVLFTIIQFGGKDVSYYFRYIGKYYKDIPQNATIESINDSFVRKELDKVVKFGSCRGKITFNYYTSDSLFDEDEISSITWFSDENTPKQYEKVKKTIEKDYGDYSSFDVSYNGDVETTIYSWYHEDKIYPVLMYRTYEDEVLEIAVIWHDSRED